MYYLNNWLTDGGSSDVDHLMVASSTDGGGGI